MKKKIGFFFVTVLLILSCTKSSYKQQVYVFHAGSLTIPFQQMEEVFEAQHPQIDIIREASGSRNAARKISDLHRRCEIMASADYSVIDKLLIEQNHSFVIIVFYIVSSLTSK